MKISPASLCAVFLACAVLPTIRSANAAEGWTPLLDEPLSQWEKWLGVPDPSVAVAGYTHEADPKKDVPLGLNHDPKNVYTVAITEGEPVLHISGEIFGGLTTLKSYGDFHFRTQFRWGEKKWPPRVNQARDNGILYHCIGAHGAMGNVWKRSVECQVQENDIGDFFPIAGTMADIPAVMEGKLPRYTPGSPLMALSSRCCRGSDYHELPNGQWNTIEVIVVGDRSLHILNGQVVNVLHHARYKETREASEEKPLGDGQIQIQSEGAEAEYRRMEIQPVTEFPAEYRVAVAVSDAKPADDSRAKQP